MFKRILAGFAFVALIATAFQFSGPTVDPVDFTNVITQQVAYADSTPFAGNPTAVSTSKMWQAPYSRMRIAIVEGDTAGAKHVVPGMSDGDYVMSVMYYPWDTLACAAGGPNRDPMDLTDSSYVYKDSLAWYDDDGSGLETDSGTVIILFNDATD